MVFTLKRITYTIAHEYSPNLTSQKITNIAVKKVFTIERKTTLTIKKLLLTNCYLFFE